MESSSERKRARCLGAARVALDYDQRHALVAAVVAVVAGGRLSVAWSVAQ
jgi:hypothetical protein